METLSSSSSSSIESNPVKIEDWTILGKANNLATFTMTGVSTAFANAFRRTVLSDIPCVVIDAESCIIPENATPPKMHHELLRKQLQCLPVFVLRPLMKDEKIENFYFKIEKQNTTSQRMVVTSEDIIVFQEILPSSTPAELIVNNPLEFQQLVVRKTQESSEQKPFFPPDPITNMFIDIVDLNPHESVKIYGTFKVSTAKESSCYNVTSCCAYGFTVDELLMKEVQEKFNEEIEKKVSLSKEEKEMRKKDFEIIQGPTFHKPMSYDFKLKSIGFYTPIEICVIACELIERQIDDIITQHQFELKLHHDTAMPNCVILTLINEDYTIGYMFQQTFYSMFYNSETPKVNFCGFSKHHAHDVDSFFVINYIDSNPNLLTIALEDMQATFVKMQMIVGNMKKSFLDNAIQPISSVLSASSSSSSRVSSKTSTPLPVFTPLAPPPPPRPAPPSSSYSEALTQPFSFELPPSIQKKPIPTLMESINIDELRAHLPFYMMIYFPLPEDPEIKNISADFRINLNKERPTNILKNLSFFLKTFVFIKISEDMLQFGRKKDFYNSSNVLYDIGKNDYFSRIFRSLKLMDNPRVENINKNFAIWLYNICKEMIQEKEKNPFHDVLEKKPYLKRWKDIILPSTK